MQLTVQDMAYSLLQQVSGG